MKKGVTFIAFFILLIFVFFLFNFLKQEELLVKPKFYWGGNILALTLEKVVSTSLEGTEGIYAVVIKNFKTGKSYAVNEDQIFEAGSLYKLWVLGAVYEGIQNGEIKEDEILSESVELLNKKFEIEEDEAEVTDGVVTLSVSDGLNQMISISHNYAALLLAQRVKNSKVKEFMDQYGFNESDLGTPPETTASDIALFFEKLYKGEIVSPDSSRRMLELLKKQQLNDSLPKYLPKEREVAHKTGDIGWFKHDGGIVFTPKGDYIIVVLSESDSPTGAQERIAQLSKAVYEYFNR